MSEISKEALSSVKKPEAEPDSANAGSSDHVHSIAPTETGNLLRVVQAAYLKHHCGLDNIGWEELSDRMCDALCNAMGDKEFQAWLESSKPQND